jgi:hypothetical protein
MTTNPFYNAGIALVYIVLVVSLINMGTQLAGPGQKDNLLIPMGMLSLFVLSAAVMGYIFFYQPVLMLLDGKREAAVRLFLQTVGVFAVITVIVLLASMLLFK